MRVVLIDDEDDARATLADRLQRLHGVELAGAVRDQREAAVALKQMKPDVLLVDLHSHHWEGDGVELCEELRKLTSAPLVVLASFMPRERWQRLQRVGVTNCLLKRVDGEYLERELIRVGTKHGSRSADPQ